jgi:hypothetical protein
MKPMKLYLMLFFSSILLINVSNIKLESKLESKTNNKSYLENQNKQNFDNSVLEPVEISKNKNYYEQ